MSWHDLAKISHSKISLSEHPPCDIPSGCCSFTGPWTVTRSSLRMLRRVAAFCRLWFSSSGVPRSQWNHAQCACRACDQEPRVRFPGRERGAYPTPVSRWQAPGRPEWEWGWDATRNPLPCGCRACTRCRQPSKPLDRPATNEERPVRRQMITNRHQNGAAPEVSFEAAYPMEVAGRVAGATSVGDNFGEEERPLARTGDRLLGL